MISNQFLSQSKSSITHLFTGGGGGLSSKEGVLCAFFKLSLLALDTSSLLLCRWIKLFSGMLNLGAGGLVLGGFATWAGASGISDKRCEDLRDMPEKIYFKKVIK